MEAATPLGCRETIRRLDDYVDRALSPEELRRVEAHLEACLACAAEYGFERALLEGIRDRLRRVAAPPGLLAALMRRVAGE
jgi:anti-sigma factor (TIGR02949 family)